jgi:hypothetical protein
MTRQFVGNYRVDIFPNVQDGKSTGTITIVLSNATSATSFFYGIAPSWGPPDAGEGNDYTSMSTVYQYYYWTEPIDAGRLMSQPSPLCLTPDIFNTLNMIQR